ncbi:unnamed protein product [Phytophthora fragariaefolia]|uniref:Unnamed protein product n=1 Tax=Phytophthora fragariaefolia TaxID=1490495 RepID=A0A9W6U8Y9_9STRA|nr:unnamed protein product [Phytophthora fragariaefolia]
MSKFNKLFLMSSSTSASLPVLSPVSASSSSSSIDASPVLQSSSPLSSGSSLSTSSIASSSAPSASDLSASYSTVACANGTSTACEAAWLLLRGVDHTNGVAVGDSALVGRRSIAESYAAADREGNGGLDDMATGEWNLLDRFSSELALVTIRIFKHKTADFSKTHISPNLDGPTLNTIISIPYSRSPRRHFNSTRYKSYMQANRCFIRS